MPGPLLTTSGRRPPGFRRGGSQRSRLVTRAVPIAVLAVAAFVVGVLQATGPGRAERNLVRRYARDWARGDYAGMYALLDEPSRHRLTLTRFRAELAGAARTATLRSLRAGRCGARRGDLLPIRMTAATVLFGTLRLTLEVPLTGSGGDARIRWSDRLLFPGVPAGAKLTRTTSLPPRAALLARDGTPLATGPKRSSPVPDVAAEIAGTLGPIPAAETAAEEAAGLPADATVGVDGLERIFQSDLAGTPGGELRAGRRVLASTSPLAGLPVTTTIDVSLERAATAALAGRYGGIVAMDPRTGELLAVAGVGFSALQPPGSTFKIITATGALEAGIAKLTDTYPVSSQARLDGVPLQNANGELCGGTLVESFANSCNSVFAPLGAKLGSAKLVDVAERFGFNRQWPFPGPAPSVIPSAQAMGNDPLTVGSSAIGQGQVQSTVLGMTVVAAAIADRGRRPDPTLRKGQGPRFHAVTSARVAHEVERMMLAVVAGGTGTAAQIPGVEVAGKTGTAELRNTVKPTSQSDPNAPVVDPAKNTDAWFVGYAPAGHPRVVVGALFPENGAGGTTAAPAVHDVLAAALKR